ncbi:hypothetical protein OAJ27_00920 [bacterium]|nr:hypothetical protein [bacterium]
MSHQFKYSYSKSSVITLLIYTIIGMFISIICFFPFISELSYRNAHMLSSEASLHNFRYIHRFTYAFEEFERAIRFFPWETHYAMEYIKELNTYTNKQTNIKTKKALILKSIDLVNYMIHIDPVNPWYHSRLSILYANLYAITKERKLISKAFHHTQQAAISDYENPIFLLNYAHLLQQENRSSEAHYYYKKALDTDERFPEGIFNLSNLYYSLNKADLALNNLLKLKKSFPNFRSIDASILSTYIYLNELKKGESYIHTYSLYTTKEAKTIEMIASLYFLQKKYDSAISFLDVYLNLPEFQSSPVSPKIYKLYVSILEKSKTKKEAKDWISNIIYKFPTTPFLQTIKDSIK